MTPDELKLYHKYWENHLRPAYTSFLEKEAYGDGFSNGYVAALEHYGEQVKAYQDYLAGKITMGELERRLKGV